MVRLFLTLHMVQEVSRNFIQQNIYEVAKERVELLQNSASKKNVKLTLMGSDTYVLSNRGMLIELLDNLIQNAIRYNNGLKIEKNDKDRIFPDNYHPFNKEGIEIYQGLFGEFIKIFTVIQIIIFVSTIFLCSFLLIKLKVIY